MREGNRGISLLQTKMQYTERQNCELVELCNKLKSRSLSSSSDILDTLITQKVRMYRDASSPHSSPYQCWFNSNNQRFNSPSES